MSRSSRRLRLSALVLALGPMLALAACKEEVAKTEPSEPVRPVRVVEVGATASARPIVYSGTVKARVEAPLSFRVGGKIVDRKVDIGDHVEAGQAIANLDPADLQLALKAAEAGVASAEAQKTVADDALGRARQLYEKGFATKAQLDSAQLAADQAAAQVQNTTSARNQAANQTAYAALLADGPGIITDVRSDRGQVVAAGTPVVTLARDGAKEIAVAVPEQDVRFFAKDATVEVSFWAEPDLAVKGKVREVAGSADAVARTFAIRVTIPDEPRIRLGMTATVKAEVPVADAGPVVPLTALAEADGKPIVWVVDRQSATVAPRPVKVGAAAADGVRVSEGLARGDLVVTAGAQFMSPGKKVRLPDKIATAALAP